MNIISSDRNDVMLGSGFLYAIPSKQFTDNMDVSQMDEIGYIKEGESARFSRTHDVKEINSANYGSVALIGNNYVTEFSTSIISYKAENCAKYLTGSKVVTSEDGKKKTTYFAESDRIPEIALAFVGKDEDTGNTFTLYMPKAVWTGEYVLDFNNDDPVELDYTFRCLNKILPNGKNGAAYLIEETTSKEDTAA